MSREVADNFVAALWELEENENVEPLVEVHTEDCEVGNVSVPGTFNGHEGLREFWTNYRSTFGEMKSEFRNVIATEEGAALEWTTTGTPRSEEHTSELQSRQYLVCRLLLEKKKQELTPR